MSTIQELFQQAQLAEAAYANFFSNSGVLLTSDGDVTAALIAEKISPAKAADFVLHWEVVDQIPNDNVTGFSATVFKNKDTGAYSLAIRGSLDRHDFIADTQLIATDGVAKTHKSICRTMFFPWADLNQMASTKAGAIQFGAGDGHSVSGLLPNIENDYKWRVAA